MNPDPRVLKIGLTVMAAIVLLYLAMAWLSSIHLFAPAEYRYHIQFEDVNGLLTGDPVKLRGVTVGKVDHIQAFVDHVDVAVAIDQQVQVSDQASAVIQIKELLGGKQIALFPGTSPDILPPGSTIPGQLSADFSNAFSTVDQFMEQFDKRQAKALLQRGDSLSRWFAHVLTQIDPRSPGLILQNLETTSHEMARLASLSRQSAWPQQLEAETKRFDSLINQTHLLLRETQRLVSKLEDQVIDPATSLIKDGQTLTPQVRQLLARTDSLTQQLMMPNTMINRMMTDPAFSQALDSTLYHLTKVLKQIHTEKIIVGLKRKKNN